MKKYLITVKAALLICCLSLDIGCKYSKAEPKETDDSLKNINISNEGQRYDDGSTIKVGGISFIATNVLFEIMQSDPKYISDYYKNPYTKKDYVTVGTLPIGINIFILDEVNNKTIQARTGKVFDCANDIDGWKGNEIVLLNDTLQKDKSYIGYKTDSIKQISFLKIEQILDSSKQKTVDSLVRINWDKLNILNLIPKDSLNVMPEILCVDTLKLFFAKYCITFEGRDNEPLLCYMGNDIETIGSNSAVIEKAFIINGKIYIKVMEYEPNTDNIGIIYYQIINRP